MYIIHSIIFLYWITEYGGYTDLIGVFSLNRWCECCRSKIVKTAQPESLLTRL